MACQLGVAPDARRSAPIVKKVDIWEAARDYCKLQRSPSRSWGKRMKSMLNICMTSDDVHPAATGVGIHVQNISRELAKRGHRISILTTRRPGEPEQETWEGVRLYRLFTLKVY